MITLVKRPRVPTTIPVLLETRKTELCRLLDKTSLGKTSRKREERLLNTTGDLGILQPKKSMERDNPGRALTRV